jgi:branched-chain amino acid aminotransferase
MSDFEKMQGKIWLDGKICDWQEAKIHVLTHGLHYGSSVYEGIRIYNGKPFKVLEHMERLHHSAKCLGFEVPFNTDELILAMQEQIKLNNIINGYGRPVAWRGTDTMLIAGGSKIAKVAIAVWPTFEDRKDLRERGVRLCFSKWRKPAANASPYTAKAAGIYTLLTIVKNEAVDQGFDDAIMLDEAGNITESTTSNFFLITDNELHTPLPDCFLNGITRQTIIAIAKENGIKVNERKIKPEELSSAQAAFLTGTAIEIMPVKSIAEHEFDPKHELLQKIAEHYKHKVTADNS